MKTTHSIDGTTLATTKYTDLTACSLEFVHDQITKGEWSVGVFRAWADSCVTGACAPEPKRRYVLVGDGAQTDWVVRKMVRANNDGSCVCENVHDHTETVVWDKWIEITPGAMFKDSFVSYGGKSIVYDVIYNSALPTTHDKATEFAEDHDGELPDPVIAERLADIGAIRGTTWTNERQLPFTAYVVDCHGKVVCHGLANQAYPVAVSVLSAR